ncbi:MAG: redoxin domain-containing protein [Thermoguttaceae bacterium]
MIGVLRVAWLPAAWFCGSALFLYGQNASDTASATYVVKMVSPQQGFEPHSIEIQAGDQITWKNVDPNNEHTATADDGSPLKFPEVDLNPGDPDVTQTFTKPGTITYHCVFHPGSMKGTIVVKPAPAANARRQEWIELNDRLKRIFQSSEFIRKTDRPWRTPAEFKSYGGVIRISLTAQVCEHNLVLPDEASTTRISTPAYNGDLVGPTIDVRPGDTLKIDLTNRLSIPVCNPAPSPRGLASADAGHEGEPAGPHGFDVTNLHLHGLHVSPKDRQDNVFVEIPSGGCFPYEVYLPKNHVGGTFWYHAHKHGSVAYQLSGGMAGALIVRGALDELLTRKSSAIQRLFVLQQYQLEQEKDGTLRACPEVIYPSLSVGTANPGTVPLYLVNGQIQPHFAVKPGAVEHWRFIHAGITETISPQVVKFAAADTAFEHPLPVTLKEVAIDGIPRPRITDYDKKPYAMYPGYRWDVVFVAPDTPGQDYYLINAPTSARQSLRGVEQPAKYLAKITVEQAPAEHHDLPTDAELAACIPRDFRPIGDDEIGNRKCAVNFKGLPPAFPFGMDGQPFDPLRIDRVARLDTADEWTLSISRAHVFHVHVNPFEQIVKNAQGEIEDRIWRDTLAGPDAPPLTRTIRIRYQDFTGDTVLHCHRLEHEDEGMMEHLRILGRGEPVPPNVRVPCPAGSVADAGGQVNRRFPDFDLTDPLGKNWRLRDYAGSPVVVVLFRGFGCLHCAQQLQELARQNGRFAELGVRIIAVSSDELTVLSASFKSYAANKSAPVIPFPIVADGRLELFQKAGCLSDHPLHGTFLLDDKGIVQWSTAGETPYMDIDSLFAECRANTSVSQKKGQK